MIFLRNDRWETRTQKQENRKRQPTCVAQYTAYCVRFYVLTRCLSRWFGDKKKKPTQCDIHPHTLPPGLQALVLDWTQSNSSSWIQKRWPRHFASSSASESGHDERTTGCKTDKDERERLWKLSLCCLHQTLLNSRLSLVRRRWLIFHNSRFW